MVIPSTLLLLGRGGTLSGCACQFRPAVHFVPHHPADLCPRRESGTIRDYGFLSHPCSVIVRVRAACPAEPLESLNSMLRRRMRAMSPIARV